MDADRFDTLTIRLSHHLSRRAGPVQRRVAVR
jgi:hypothetical protein